MPRRRRDARARPAFLPIHARHVRWRKAKLTIACFAPPTVRNCDVVIGALTARSENAIAPRVLASYEGWPLKIVTGYAGFSEVLIAAERGAVDGLFTHEGSVANTRPDMI